MSDERKPKGDFDAWAQPTGGTGFGTTTTGYPQRSGGSLLYYRHSGRYSPAGLLLGLGAGALAAVALACAYAYIILYCPLIYINFLVTLGFGFGVGMLGAKVLKSQRVRNSGVAGAVGAVLGLVALYAEWVFWVFGFLGRADVERSLLGLAVDPGVLWSVILKVNEVGAWTLKGSTPTGLFLWVVWGIEAAVIVGAAVVGALSTMDDEPYCEVCDSWCPEEKEVARFKTAEAAQLKPQLEARNLGFLEGLGAPEADAMSWLRADLHPCKKCGQTNTLTVKSVAVTLDKKNKRSEKETDLVKKLLITESDRDKVRQMGKAVAPVLGVSPLGAG